MDQAQTDKNFMSIQIAQYVTGNTASKYALRGTWLLRSVPFFAASPVWRTKTPPAIPVASERLQRR